MPVQLYRKGDTHEVRGVKCEVKNVSLAEMYPMLEDGWVKDPAELVEKPKKRGPKPKALEDDNKD